MTISTEQKPNPKDFISLPVHEQSWRELLGAVPKRIVGLISKLIGVKITMFATATVLLVLYITRGQPIDHGWVPWVVWGVLYIATLFGWDGLKWISTIAALRYGRAIENGVSTEVGSSPDMSEEGGK